MPSDWTIDTSWIQWPLINLLFDGDAAVTLFFVLSGFVLARPYVKHVKPPQPRPLGVNSFLSSSGDASLVALAVLLFRIAS